MNKALPKETILNSRYRIEQQLGEGGFAVTYLAEDLELGRNVVLKEYFPYTLSERDEEGNVSPVPGEKTTYFYQGKERFLKEAKIQASLFEIPGVVKVLGYFEAGNTVYEVMEWIKGTTLRKYLGDNGEIPDFPEAYEMLKPVFEAVSMIHEKGYLHRDISPDNIMVQEDGKVKLLDFGTARSYLANLDQVKTMTVFVKDGFTPLEQYDPHGKQGPWTDIYSLSAVLYFLMTGYTPDSARQRQLQDTLFSPSEFGCSIDPDTEAKLMKKGLAVDWEERYRSVPDMREDLFGKEQPEKQKTSARRVVLPVLFTACALLMLSLFAGYAWKKSIYLPESVTAGDYDRGSEKYESFLTFVKENAQDVKDTEGGTIYSLPREAVLEWGEPSNQPLLPCSWDEVMAGMGEDAAEIELTDEKDILTVTDKGYGSLDTSFMDQRQYKLPNGCQICVLTEIITGRLYSVNLSQMEEDMEELFGSAEKLAAGIFGIEEPYAEDIVAGLRNSYDEHAEDIRDASWICWNTVENDNQIIAWQYDKEQGYSLLYHYLE